MATKAEMCNYSPDRPRGKLAARGIYVGRYELRRATCPDCGRRLLGKVWHGMEEGGFAPLLPPHKRKGWWKKRTKKIEKRMAPRGK